MLANLLCVCAFICAFVWTGVSVLLKELRRITARGKGRWRSGEEEGRLWRRVAPTSRQVLRSYRCYRNPRKRGAGLYCQRVYLSGENVRRSAYIATKGPLFESSLDVTLRVDSSEIQLDSTRSSGMANRHK